MTTKEKGILMLGYPKVNLGQLRAAVLPDLLISIVGPVCDFIHILALSVKHILAVSLAQ